MEPVHSSSSKVEVVGDAGVPVIEPAGVYRNGEVVGVDSTIVDAVDSFEVPAGLVRKGARERFFMYSVGVYAEKIETDKTKKKSGQVLPWCILYRYRSIFPVFPGYFPVPGVL